MKIRPTKITALLLAMMVSGETVIGQDAATAPESASAETSAATDQSSKTLRGTFADSFHMGTALSNRQLNGNPPEVMPLVAKQFSAITPENLMKWQLIHPRVDEYNFGPVDKYVEFGEANDMFIVGHTLVWHSQTPRWVFQDDEGNDLTREALLERMRDHIHTIVGKYKGRIHGYDVVNEAINDNNGQLRESPWLRIIGPDFIEHAFRFAHGADPDAELYYNDYNLHHEAKRKAAIALAKDLHSKGIPITGVGLQCHYGYDRPTLGTIENSFQEYVDELAPLGMKLMVTELDVDVLAGAGIGRREGGGQLDGGGRGRRGRGRNDPFPNGLPEEISNQLAKRYEEIFGVFMKHRDHITRVTFWGVDDGQSWKNRGRTNYPLIFDRDFSPKQPAFDTIIKQHDDIVAGQ